MPDKDDRILYADMLSVMSRVIIQVTNELDKHPEWNLPDITLRFDKLAFSIGTYTGDPHDGYQHFFHVLNDADSELNHRIDQKSIGGFIMLLIRSLVAARVKYIRLDRSVDALFNAKGEI